jgi:hypothetical protein
VRKKHKSVIFEKGAFGLRQSLNGTRIRDFERSELRPLEAGRRPIANVDLNPL